jgi:hypothetical protein
MLQGQKETARSCVNISYEVTVYQQILSLKHLDEETSCEATVIKINVVTSGLKESLESVGN